MFKLPILVVLCICIALVLSGTTNHQIYKLTYLSILFPYPENTMVRSLAEPLAVMQTSANAPVTVEGLVEKLKTFFDQMNENFHTIFNWSYPSEMNVACN